MPSLARIEEKGWTRKSVQANTSQECRETIIETTASPNQDQRQPKVEDEGTRAPPPESSLIASPATTSIIIPEDEIYHDELHYLKKPNGKIFQRKPGVPNVHDGQMMVRLQRGRFILLDYGYVPKEGDLLLAQDRADITIYPDSGKKQCTGDGCTKVGIPVQLFDSEPKRPPSKYSNSGLCYTCQKAWNDNWRGSKKRKSSKRKRKRVDQTACCGMSHGELCCEGLDTEVCHIIKKEKERQNHSLVLDPSENYVSKSVLDAMGSVMWNDCEMSRGAKNDHENPLNALCQRRALRAFDLSEENWGVNVQSLSCPSAVFQVCTAILNTHDRILVLSDLNGGDPSQTVLSHYFETMPYRVDITTGCINYDEMEKRAELFRPKLIIAGAWAYPQRIDYKRIWSIADKVGSFVLADISPISGLMAGKVIPPCFPWVDVATTSTDQSLRGPQGAIIFYRKGQHGNRKGKKPITRNLEQKINLFTSFGHQHNNCIAALAVSLGEAMSAEFSNYQQQVLKNSSRLSSELLERGYDLVSGGTENHLIIVNVKSTCGVDAGAVQRVLNKICIRSATQSVPGDTAESSPSGICLGTPAATSRGLKEDDFATIAELFDGAVEIASQLQELEGKSKFEKGVRKCDIKRSVDGELAQMRKKVIQFVSSFSATGYE